MPPPWASVKDIFHTAAEFDELQRRRYLDSACGIDTELRLAVERLLAADEVTDDMLASEIETVAFQSSVFSPGEILAERFEIVRLIGRGGMGEVYQARDRQLDNHVALKTILPEFVHNSRMRERFKKEILLARQVSHRNICRIYDLAPDHADHRDALLFSMELIEGETLAEHLKREERLSMEEALPLVRQMAEGLAALHAENLVHRDFKPGNVMLVRDSSGEIQVKIMDFGLIRPTVRSDRGGVAVTDSLGVVGTPQYMAPEQLAGQKVTTAADVYAFGVVLYEMVTGKRPYDARTDGGSAVQKEVPPEPPSSQVEDLDGRWDGTILHCLDRTPEERPPDILGVVEKLEVGNLGLWANLQRAATTVSRLVHENLRAAAAIGAVLTILLALVGFFWRSELIGLRNRAAAAVAGMLNPAPESGGSRPDAVHAYEAYGKGMDLLERFDISGNLDLAIEAFEEALTYDPEYASAHAGLADAYRRTSDENRQPELLEEAMENAERAVELDDMLAYARVTLGVICERTGDSDRAVRELQHAIKLSPHDGDAHRELAVVYKSQGRIEEAELEFEKVEPKDWRFFAERGAFYTETGRREKAVEDFKEVIEQNPNSDRGFLGLSGAYLRMGRYAEAAGLSQQALSIRPEARTYNNLGSSLYHQGLFAEAAAAYRKTAEAEGNRFLAWGNLGDALHWNSQRQEAAEAYETAIKQATEALAVNPENEQVRVRVAGYQAKMSRCGDARKKLSQLSESANSDPTVQKWSALVHKLCGQREMALTLLERAIEGGYSIADINIDPWFADLREANRYQSIVRSKQPETAIDGATQ